MTNFRDLKGSSCYVIAEAGLNHNGSIEIAKKLIDLAYVAGANAVKFQKRTVKLLAVKDTLDAKDDRFPEFGKTYRTSGGLILNHFSELILGRNFAEFRHFFHIRIGENNEEYYPQTVKIGVDKSENGSLGVQIEKSSLFSK